MKRVMVWVALIVGALVWMGLGYHPKPVNEVTGETVYCGAGEWLNTEGTGCEPLPENTH